MNLKQQMFKKLFFLIIVLFVPLFLAVNFFIGILIDIFYTRYYEMKAESFNEYKIKKMEIGRIVLRNLRNNREINMYLKDGSMLDTVPRKKEIEGYNYYRYVTDPINRVRISKIINELLADYGETSLEVYNDKKEKIVSIGEQSSDRALINSLELSKNFGEISKFVVKNGNLYLQYYGMNTDLSSLLVLGIKIDDNDVYELEKAGLKLIVAEKRSGEVAVSSYFDGDKINNLAELKDKKYSKYKIMDIENIDSYGRIYSIKIGFITKREFYMNRVWQTAGLIFILIMITVIVFTAIITKSLRKMLATIEARIKSDNQEEKSRIKEIAIIQEEIDELKKRSLCNTTEAVDALNKKESEVKEIYSLINLQNRFLKTIATENSVEEILKKSYNAISEICSVVEIKFSTILKGAEDIKVITVNKEGRLEESYQQDDGVSEFIIEGRKLKLKGESGDLICTMFKTENIASGIVTLVYNGVEGKNNNIEEFFDVMVLSLKSAKFYEMSIKDSVTGIYNRSVLNFYTKELINKNQHGAEEDFSLILVKLDKLKEINEKYGYITGDYIVKKSAERLKEYFNVDTIFRYGGKEFIILLPKVKKEGAYEIVENIREEFKKEGFKFDKFFSKEIQVTLSAAVTEYNSSKHKKVGDIVKELYYKIKKAEEIGGNKTIM